MASKQSASQDGIAPSVSNILASQPDDFETLLDVMLSDLKTWVLSEHDRRLAYLRKTVQNLTGEPYLQNEQAVSSVGLAHGQDASSSGLANISHTWSGAAKMLVQRWSNPHPDLEDIGHNSAVPQASVAHRRSPEPDHEPDPKNPSQLFTPVGTSRSLGSAPMAQRGSETPTFLTPRAGTFTPRAGTDRNLASIPTAKGASDSSTPYTPRAPPLTPTAASVFSPRSVGPRIRDPRQSPPVADHEEPTILEGVSYLSSRSATGAEHAMMSPCGTESALTSWIYFVEKLLTPVRPRAALKRSQSATNYQLHDLWMQFRNQMIQDEAAAGEDVEFEDLLESRDFALSRFRPIEKVRTHERRYFFHLMISFPWDPNFRMIWTSLGLLLVLYEAVMIPVFIFFFVTQEGFVGPWVVRIFWTLDIPLSIIAGRRDIRGFSREEAARYLKSFFLLDFAVVISDWFVPYANDIGGHSLASIFQAFCVLRLFRFYFHTGNFFAVLRKAFMRRVDIMKIVASMLKTSFGCAVALHWLACVSYGVGRVDRDGWAHDESLESHTLQHKYIVAVIFVLAQANGSCDPRYRLCASTMLEQGFALVSLFLGLVVFAFFIAKMTNSVILLANLEPDEMLDVWDRFRDEHCISSRLSRRARRHVSVRSQQQGLSKQLQQDEHLMTLLPKSLRMDIKCEALAPLCMRIEFIKISQFVCERIIRKLCNEAVSIHLSLAADVIFVQGDPCNCVYIIQTGCFKYRLRQDRNRVDETLAQAQNMLGGSADEPQMSDATKDARVAALLNDNITQLQEGRYFSEAILWTQWRHVGDLSADVDGTLLHIDPRAVTRTIFERKEVASLAVCYAERFTMKLNSMGIVSDLFAFTVDPDTEDAGHGNRRKSRRKTRIGSKRPAGHLIFLSHYKAEAGTEATLMYESLSRMISADLKSPGNRMSCPVFLDSANLSDLNRLREHVMESQNLILLLTPGVLTRPWCLVEIVTAASKGVRIVPVEVQRPGLSFRYPDEGFYEKLKSGEVLGESGAKILTENSIDLNTLEGAIRHVFTQIALSFSPHKSADIRQAELTGILERCAGKTSDSGPKRPRLSRVQITSSAVDLAKSGTDHLVSSTLNLARSFSNQLPRQTSPP